MQVVFPDYYKHFSCIAGSCRHNCCIGWEIDIDPETLARYQAISGDMGQRLRRHISLEGDPHFLLGDQERCPFLNAKNLCDIITHLGEDHLCAICRDHPRFRNELPGRIETGLGLCCEAAGQLILGWESPTVLEIEGAEEVSDPIIALRDQAIAALQDRSRTIPERIQGMLTLCSAEPPAPHIPFWTRKLLELERLDAAWTELLLRLQAEWEQADTAGFDLYMATRQREYEQILVYVVYRHMANASTSADLAARAALAALCYFILHAAGAMIWTTTGSFSFSQQVELARLFSSEIEYSEENLELLLDELC